MTQKELVTARKEAMTDRDEIIALAVELDGDPLAADDGPGRYEGEADPALTDAIDYLSVAGAADEIGGHSDYGIGHVARVGRYVVSCDSRGFRTLHTFDSEDAASAFVQQVDADDEAGNEF